MTRIEKIERTQIIVVVILAIACLGLRALVSPKFYEHCAIDVAGGTILGGILFEVAREILTLKLAGKMSRQLAREEYIAFVNGLDLRAMISWESLCFALICMADAWIAMIGVATLMIIVSTFS